MNLQDFQRVLKQAFFVPLLALLALAGILIWQVSTAQEAQRWLDHSDRVSGEINVLERLIIDQETGLRGYELTGDRDMLDPFSHAGTRITVHFDTLHGLLAGNQQQLANLATIHDRYDIWLNFTHDVLAHPTASGDDKALNHHGKELMDSIRNAMRTMGETERRVRQQRLDAALILERREFIVIVTGAILVGLLLSVFSLTRLRRVSRAYRKTLDELQLRSNEIYERREWLQTTLRSIGDAVIVCNPESGIQFMNPVAEDLTGWPLHDAMDKPLEQVFHIINEYTRQLAENPVEKVRRLNKVIGLANHTMLLSREGSEYVIDDSAAPIRDKNGTLIGIVLVFRDVTAQRRSEAALVASEKLAIAGRLAASIAHEIHNPLDSVANLHYLLADENDPAQRAQYLSMAQQELSRTMQISRTMLNLYREPNKPVDVDLRGLLEDVILLLQRRLDENLIQVERNFDGNFTVEGFPGEFRQVFTNLIINAADAAGPRGRIRIRMTGVQAENGRGSGTIIEVTDSGPGITEQASQKIFQPFFTTKGDKGTGLGLWVSMGIVHKHGGTIRISNSEETELHGATVRVYLPARMLPASEATH